MKNFVYNQIPDLEKNNWWFQGRRKIILTIIDSIFKNKNDLVILDAGCGGGSIINILEKYGKVFGIDNSKKMVKLCRFNQKEVVLGKLEKIPFEDNKFDLVVALEVLEHIKKDLLALKEINRVLKPGGYLFLSVPAFKFLWGNQDVAANHKRRYSEKQLIKQLNLAGFVNNKINFMNFIFFIPIAIVRVLRRFISREKPELDSKYFDNKTIINKFFAEIFKIEAKILPFVKVPFGATLLSVSKK